MLNKILWGFPHRIITTYGGMQMSFLKTLKPNKPVVGLEGYFMVILGKSKFGKTTFVYDLIKEYYDGDMSKAILLAPEVGFKTLDGIYALPIADFNKTSDEQKEDLNQYGFIETVDELIENKKEIPFRTVIIDTLTALEDLAIKYVLRTESRKKGKKFTAISDIPYGNGYNMVAEAIYGQIDRLKKAGFAVIVIAHEKIKQVKNRDGSEYNLITINCQGKTVDIMEREADLIIYGDLVTEVDNGTITQKRYLRFRSDGNIVCGSRFRTMPDYIDLDVQLFLETFKQAVIDSFNGNVEEVKKAEKEQEKEREQKAEKYIEQEGNKKTPEEYISEMDGLVKSMKKEQSDKLKAELKKEFGSINYKKYEVEQLEKAIEICKEILG
jgi:AAA domain